MPSSDVWLVLPSANQVNCARTLPLWRDMGYRVAVLQDCERFACDADVVVERDAYPGWPATVNQLWREVVPADVDVIIAAGDDMYPDPRFRAQELREQFLEHFQGSFGVMQPHGDAFEDTKQFCGSPWLGRAWMDRMYQGRGGMCDAYTHHWADDELYWVSRCLGALWSRDDVIQYHEHFRRSKQAAPAYWLNSVQANDEADTMSFIARSRCGFPGHEPAWPAGEPAPTFDRELFRSEYHGRAETYWRVHHDAPPEISEAERRLGEAFERCATLGHTRVAVYGAGQHTRRGSPSLMNPPVDIVAIVDDNPALRGKTLWNFPVASLAEARSLVLDAIVLSSDAMEPALRRSAETLKDTGVAIVALYTDPAVDAPSPATLSQAG